MKSAITEGHTEQCMIFSTDIYLLLFMFLIQGLELTISADKKQITNFEAGGGVRWYTLGQSVSQSRLSFSRNNEKRWTPYVSRIWQLVAVFFFQIKFSVRIPY